MPMPHQPSPHGAFPWLWRRGEKAREKRPGDKVEYHISRNHDPFLPSNCMANLLCKFALQICFARFFCRQVNGFSDALVDLPSSSIDLVLACMFCFSHYRVRDGTSENRELFLSYVVLFTCIPVQMYA